MTLNISFEIEIPFVSVLSFSQNKSWIHRGNIVRHMVHRWSKWCLNQHYSMQPDLGKFVGIITGKSNSVWFLKNPHKAVSHLNTKLCMSCYKIICLGKNTIIKVPQVNYTNFLPELYVCLFGFKTKNEQCQQTYHTAIFSVGFYSVQQSVIYILCITYQTCFNCFVETWVV